MKLSVDGVQLKLKVNGKQIIPKDVTPLQAAEAAARDYCHLLAQKVTFKPVLITVEQDGKTNTYEVRPLLHPAVSRARRRSDPD